MSNLTCLVKNVLIFSSNHQHIPLKILKVLIDLIYFIKITPYFSSKFKKKIKLNNNFKMLICILFNLFLKIHIVLSFLI